MKLVLGYDDQIEVRRYVVNLPVAKPVSVLYLSDLHLNRFTASITKRIAEITQELNPDLILLGGDYLDTKSGRESFAWLLSQITTGRKVLAIAGNHDGYFGVKAVRYLVEKQHVLWLEKQIVCITINGVKMRIAGNADISSKENADINILCLHQPKPLNKIAGSYDLIVAGHLHGGQVILWKNKKGFYPGRLFYRCNFPEQETRETLYLVSKGLGDTLPVRFNCPKDLLFITIQP